jgi:hypothetical protein
LLPFGSNVFALLASWEARVPLCKQVERARRIRQRRPAHRPPLDLDRCYFFSEGPKQGKPCPYFRCSKGKRDASAGAYVLGGGVRSRSSDRLRAEDARRRPESIMDGRTGISLAIPNTGARPVMDVPR